MTREPQNATPSVELFSAEELERTLRRLALQVLEDQDGVHDLVLIGIYTRGVPLAHRLARFIEEQEGVAPPVGALDVTLYRDDLREIGVRTPERTQLPVDLQGKKVVLVDDVLYKGRTVRAALDALNDYGRPTSIRLLVLIDRGHRELPIHPDYCGKEVPTARHEQVKVFLKETDAADRAVLMGGKS
jgi:pyrimidine operon attenuation protein/uracil phosphoribosyltransferase